MIARILLTLLLAVPAQAVEDYDPVALATMLVRDGHYGRAERVLGNLSEKDDVDKEKVEFLWGAVALHHRDYSRARQKFLNSLAQGLSDTEVYLYLADVELRTNNVGQAKAYIDKVGRQWQDKLPYDLLKAEILWQQGQKIAAWATLDKAEKRGLGKDVIGKKKFAYLLSEKLYLAAFAGAKKFLLSGGNLNDVVAMASQLRQHGQLELGLMLLQMAQFSSPAHELLLLEMAQNYLAQNSPYSAALILEQGARLNNNLAFEAAELLRNADKNYRARYLNLLTVDPQKQLKQKMALYLADNDYHSINYLLPQLQKYSLLDSDEIRYAVAYSLFQVGELQRSVKMLSRIQESELFEKSVELRKEIQKCEQDPWGCYEAI